MSDHETQTPSRPSGASHEKQRIVAGQTFWGFSVTEEFRNK